MRILFLTQWFQPEPFFKGLPFAKALQDRGHEVEVLTGFPNYPGGNVYPGYRVRLYRSELMDGIRVHRVALYPSHDRSVLRRILNYLSFSFSAFIFGPWLVKRPDIIYIYNLVTLGPVAFLLRIFFGTKVIIDVQDLWPESVVSSRMMKGRFALALIDGICKWVYQKADRVTVLSPGFRDALIKRGVAPGKIEVVYNWCDEASVAANASPVRLPDLPMFAGKFVVLFAGTMGVAQGLDTILDCARMCQKMLPKACFVLIGNGMERERLQKRSEELGLENVVFLPSRPMEAMPEIFALADALIVHLKDDPLYRITIPSKTQAYLYTGKPIIMAVSGNAADIVRGAGAGVVCEPDNPAMMMSAVQALCEMPDEERRKLGEAGRTFYLKNLSFKSGVDRFEKAFILCLGRT